mgnify:CR=1 FL=1
MNNRKIKMYDIIGVGFMAALVFVASQISIPIPSILGLTRIHLGNAFCLLSGFILGGFRGGLAAGIGSLPRGQKQAATALGLTTFQAYRYILLPIAFRIIMPPLTSETMNMLKNSSVAFAVSVAELTWFYTQAAEETSKGIEIFLGVTLLYVISAFAVNRIMAFIEKKIQIPGFIVAGGTGGGH